MSNTITFSIDGVGTFEFRPQLTHLEETKLNLIVNRFMDYKLNEMRDEAFRFQDIAMQNILKRKFNGRKQSELSNEEKSELELLYKGDLSNEAVIAKQLFWDILLIETPFKLDILKVRVPDGFDLLKIDKSKDDIFYKILSKFNKAVEPIEQKKK